MTTTVTKSIGSAGGRDFATIGAWISYVTSRGDITASGTDEIHVGELYNDSVFTETTLVIGYGVVLDATHTVTLRAAAGQGFNANANKLTNALRYNEANGVAIRLTNAGTGTLNSLGGTVLDGVQILSTGAHAGSMFTTVVGTVQNSIIDAGTSTTTTSSFFPQISASGAIRNVVAVGAVAGRPFLTSSSAIVGTIEGCSFVNTAGSTVVAVASSTNGRAAIRDNAFVGFVGQNLASNAGPTFTTNATDGTLNVGSGVGGMTAANQFQNVASASTLDLRLKSTSSLRGAGTASATLVSDILLQTRASPPAIGAYEYVAVATPAPAPVPRRHARMPLGLLN